MLGRKVTKQREGLIELLADESANFGDRHDAAMYLGDFDDPAAEDALLKVALNLAADPDLVDACGESLFEIWTRKGTVDSATVAKLHPEARKFFWRDDG